MNYAHLNPKSPPTFHNQITSVKKNHEKITQENLAQAKQITKTEHTRTL